ncbi:MAG: YcjX family protein, partial [Pseudomonadota bacterium]
LSGAGKTVFITALTLSLLERDRMRRFGPAAKGRIAAAMLRSQPSEPPKAPPTEEPKAPARDTLPGGFSLGALADDPRACVLRRGWSGAAGAMAREDRSSPPPLQCLRQDRWRRRGSRRPLA